MRVLGRAATGDHEGGASCCPRDARGRHHFRGRYVPAGGLRSGCRGRGLRRAGESIPQRGVMLRINNSVSIIFNYISAGVSEYDEDSLTEIGTGRDRERKPNHERMQHDTKLEDLSKIVNRHFLVISGEI
jgi:hypothetical protein